MSYPKETHASAIITLKLEVVVGVGWGPECSIGQVYDQALDSAMRRVRRALEEELRSGGIKILATPGETSTVLVKS